MDVLDCVGIELIIEGMRPKLFEILSNNVLEPSTFCEKEVTSGNLSIEILDEFNDSRSQDGISIAKVLNARVGSTNYRYYILKIRGFYCLPAFLAPTLPRPPGLLRLVVENQIQHYYIFTNQAELPSVFKGAVYNFNVPVLQQEVAFSVSTKDINVFPNSTCLRGHGDLYERYRNFDPKQGSFTFSLSNQSYLLTSNSRLASRLCETSLINRNLFDYLCLPASAILNNHSFTILLLQEPSPAEPFITPEENALVEKFFTEKPFRKSKKHLKYLLKHIKNQYAKYKDSQLKTYFSAILPVLQSSGYGKSRSLIELGKHLPLFTPPCSRAKVFLPNQK